jgi:hypothetical protein
MAVVYGHREEGNLAYGVIEFYQALYPENFVRVCCVVKLKEGTVLR